MSWVNLATVGWGSSPTIQCNFQYDRRRNGAAMEYNVWVGVNSTRASVYFGYPIYCDIKVNGTTVKTATMKSANPSTWSDRLELYSGWTSVANKTSGTTSVSIRLYSGGGSTRDNTYSYSMAVDPAGSTLTVTGTRDLGEAQTLTLARYNDDFTDSIGWTCENSSGTIATKSSATSFAFTPAVSLAAENTTGTNVTIIYTVDTYSGNTLVQSQSYNIVYMIPATVIPTAAVSIADHNGYYSTYGAYIQGKSALDITVTGTPVYSSPIAAYSATADGTTYNTASTTTPALTLTGAQTVSAYVTDARGRVSTTATAAYNVLAYAAPKITSINAYRSDSNGTADPTGHYVTVIFNSDVTALNNQNSVTYTVGYKKTSVNTWTTQTLSTYTDNFNVSDGTATFAAADDSPYDVRIVATDNFTSTTITSSAPMAFALINWNSNGDGIAFGGISTAAGFVSHMGTTISADLDVTGDYKQNGTNLFPLAVANGGTGETTIIAALRALLGGVYEYSTSTTNPLTTAAQSTEQKTYTAQNAGLVFLSGSMRVSGGTYGSTMIAIEKNDTVIAYANDRLLSAWTGDVATHAAAMVKVAGGDVLEISQTSTRYTSGNTATRYYNVVAFGTELTIT